jgi:hypothetical protein
MSLSLPLWSRVARRCPPSFRPFGGAVAEDEMKMARRPDGKIDWKQLETHVLNFCINCRGRALAASLCTVGAKQQGVRCNVLHGIEAGDSGLTPDLEHAQCRELRADIEKSKHGWDGRTSF